MSKHASIIMQLQLQQLVWSPSKMIAKFGKEINNPDSVYYWAYKVCRVLLISEYLHTRPFFFFFFFASEQHPRVLSRPDRWVPGRYDLHPLLQEPWTDCRHCPRYMYVYNVI